MADSDYFALRSRQERIAAQSAPNSAIAAVHTKLADLYDQAANQAAKAATLSLPAHGLGQAL